MTFRSTPRDCPCGSGKEREQLIDGRGIFCCYYCEDCYDEKAAKYRPEILNTCYSEDDVCEAIEPE